MSHLQTIAEHLTSRRQTVTCAESCTGGLLAGALTSLSGSSQWFHQSFVTYSNQAKQDRLGVMPDTLLKHGAVSRETVYEMARGAKAVAQADYALSISGIAGPGGGSAAKPVGTVWFAWPRLKARLSKPRFSQAIAKSVRAQAVEYALAFLAEHLVDRKNSGRLKSGIRFQTAFLIYSNHRRIYTPKSSLPRKLPFSTPGRTKK